MEERRERHAARAGTIRAAAGAAFPNTLPILTGFLFVGMAFGIYVCSLGYPPIVPILMSALIFAGSMQFVAASFLSLPFAPVSSFFATLIFNARHMFYGISMLEKYRACGRKKGLTIFWMCDETFTVNYAADVPEGVDRGWFYFFVSLFDYLYWLGATALGALCGDLIPFDTTGIDFVMTALFLVLFVNNWEKERSHVSSLAGLVVTAVCLVVFGPDRFILAAMAALVCLLTLLRGPMERRLER